MNSVPDASMDRWPGEDQRTGPVQNTTNPAPAAATDRWTGVDRSKRTSLHAETEHGTTSRRVLPARRNHVTQKVRVPGRTLYLTVHDDTPPGEVFLRVKGPDCTTEVIALYDVIARLSSLALQYGVPIEEIGEMLLGSKFEPAGPVQGHPRIKNCSSLCDLLGRHLLVECTDRKDLAHVPATRSQGPLERKPV